VVEAGLAAAMDLGILGSAIVGSDAGVRAGGDPLRTVLREGPVDVVSRGVGVGRAAGDEGGSHGRRAGGGPGGVEVGLDVLAGADHAGEERAERCGDGGDGDPGTILAHQAAREGGEQRR